MRSDSEAPSKPTYHRTEEEFEERYKPRSNHLLEDAPFNGWMYETFGEELAAVKAEDPRHVWTYIYSDGVALVAAGNHLVNRLGYILTEVPWETGLEEVILEDLSSEEKE